MVDPIFFNRNKIHIFRTAAVLTASSTDLGYAVDNCREDSLASGWKPVNGSSDQWIKADLGDTTSLGAAASTAYFAVAYDARGAQQTKMTLQYDTADNASFTSPADIANITLNIQNYEGVNCDYFSFTVPTAAKRYYRLMQKNSDRGGGTKTATVLYWGLFVRAGMRVFPGDFTPDSVASYRIRNLFRSGVARTAGDVPLINEYAKIGNSVELSFKPATATLWDTFRGDWDLNSNNEAPVQAIFLQAQGLYNIAKQNFFLCRLSALDWEGSVEQKDVYEMSMSFETEPWL